jgi:hypothetical protein
MHKYFEMKPPKVKGTEQEQELDSEGEDPEMNAFADKAIEDKMRELQRGSGIVDEDSDDLDI